MQNQFIIDKEGAILCLEPADTFAIVGFTANVITTGKLFPGKSLHKGSLGHAHGRPSICCFFEGSIIRAIGAFVDIF